MRPLCAALALFACIAGCSSAQQLAVMNFDGTTASVEPNRLVQVSRASARLTVQLKGGTGQAIAQVAVEPSGDGCNVSPTQGVSDANGVATFSLSSCGDGNAQLVLDAVSGSARRRLAAEPNFIVYTPTGLPAASFAFIGPPFAKAGRAEVYELQTLDDAGARTDQYEGLTQLTSDGNAAFSASAQPNLQAGWAGVLITFTNPGVQTLTARSVSDPTLQGNMTIDVYATSQ